MLENITQIEMITMGLVTVFLLFISYKVGASFATKRWSREKEKLELESHSSHKSLKRILEDEKSVVDNENKELKDTNDMLNGRIEDYRKKLAGMGLLSFSGSKRRSDILYSLLLENEALEQLISEQSEKLATERGEHLMHRMKDIRKRQRLLAEIFNDDTIKNYVKEVLSDDVKIDDAVHKLENTQAAGQIEGNNDI
jgi:hypothetical protein